MGNASLATADASLCFAASGSERTIRATGNEEPRAARQRELVMLQPQSTKCFVVVQRAGSLQFRHAVQSRPHLVVQRWHFSADPSNSDGSGNQQVLV